MPLNLFPARVPFGRWTDADGNSYDVLMTPEFSRALADLFERVGGPIADSNTDLSIISSTQDAPADFGHIIRQVADLQRVVGLLEAQRAENGVLRNRVNDLEQTLAQVPAVFADLRKRVADIEREVVSVAPPTDWAHPRAIGAGTPAAGTFTNLTYSEQLTSTVATGTAPMVVSSTTKVANLNADLLDGTDWRSPGPIGGTTPGSGAFTTVSATGQITSTQATGTAPLMIASTTKVANLNVDLLDGGDWASPGAIGTTTPANATFVGLTATGTVNLGSTAAASAVVINGNNSGVGGGVFVTIRNGGSDVLVMGNKSAIAGGAYSNTPYIRGGAGGVAIEFEAGFKTNGNVGFYGTTPVAKPTVTGSRGGNAALASLLTSLAAFGLLTDSSTA